jgi:hypothetical protein
MEGIIPVDGREVILVAQAEGLGALLRDVVGADSSRGFARKIGVSSAYAGSLLAGYVPSDDILGRIAVAYDLDHELTTRLFDAAREVRADIDPERLLQTACSAGGLSTAGRIAVLDCFRTIKKQEAQQEQAA